MNAFEIVAGVVLMLCSLVIIILVLLQESKGNGLSGAIGGGEMMMMGEGRGRTADALMAKYTKIAAIIFFVLAIAVSVLSVLFK